MRPIELDGVERAYIVENEPLERLLLNRRLVGVPFMATCREASALFVRHFADELIALKDETAELLVLTKGLYYRLGDAYADATGANLELNVCHSTRTASERGVSTAITAFDFTAGGRTLLIGDTVASGTTACAALDHYLGEHRLERVYFFTYAGAGRGVAKIAALCSHKGVQLTIALGLAAFGLGSNGFDLAFLHPETITRAAYTQRAEQVFQHLPISAVGWDFGSQAQCLRKYRALCWVEARYWGLLDDEFPAEVLEPTDYRLIRSERGAFEARLPELAARAALGPSI